MNKIVIFFFSGLAILILTVTAIYVSPLINNFDSSTANYKTLNCKLYSDNYKNSKKDLAEETEEEKKIKKEKLDYIKQELDSCNRKKAYYGLEYSAFIIDVIAGFLCSVLGLIQYLNEGKIFLRQTGLIGLILGVIGFVITLFYLVYSSLVYTSDGETGKRDEDGSFAYWDQSKGAYVCKYYIENSILSMIATFSEYGKKQYNYDKDFYQKYYYDTYGISKEFSGCQKSIYEICETQNTYTHRENYDSDSGSKPCDKLYLSPADSFERKKMSDGWLTVIILSAIIILCTICLALFGFLLFKNKEQTDGGDVKVV
jgi:hypothetical protein